MDLTTESQGARTDREMPDRNCLVCGRPLVRRFPSVQDVVTGERFQILRCPQCGLGHTSPQPMDLTPHYQSYHGDRHAFTARYCARRRMRFLRNAAGTVLGRLLDVGCGQGTFLLMAQQDGWTVAGTEMNPEPPRRLGLNVFSDLADFAPERNFECVTFWHSLEHLRDPLGTLRTVRSRLVDGGLMIIAVPDFGGLQAQLFGENWLHLDVPRHLFHFERKALDNILRAAGFLPFRWWNQEFEYDVMGWSQSALNKLVPSGHIRFFHLLTREKKAKVSKTDLLHLMAGALLSGAATPVVPLTSWMRRGGTLIVAARAGR